MAKQCRNVSMRRLACCLTDSVSLLWHAYVFCWVRVHKIVLDSISIMPQQGCACVMMHVRHVSIVSHAELVPLLVISYETLRGSFVCLLCACQGLGLYKSGSKGQLGIVLSGTVAWLI